MIGQAGAIVLGRDLAGEKEVSVSVLKAIFEDAMDKKYNTGAENAEFYRLVVS